MDNGVLKFWNDDGYAVHAENSILSKIETADNFMDCIEYATPVIIDTIGHRIVVNEKDETEEHEYLIKSDKFNIEATGRQLAYLLSTSSEDFVIYEDESYHFYVDQDDFEDLDVLLTLKEDLPTLYLLRKVTNRYIEEADFGTWKLAADFRYDKMQLRTRRIVNMEIYIEDRKLGKTIELRYRSKWCLFNARGFSFFKEFFDTGKINTGSLQWTSLAVYVDGRKRVYNNPFNDYVTLLSYQFDFSDDDEAMKDLSDKLEKVKEAKKVHEADCLKCNYPEELLSKQFIEKPEVTDKLKIRAKKYDLYHKPEDAIKMTLEQYDDLTELIDIFRTQFGRLLTKLRSKSLFEINGDYLIAYEGYYANYIDIYEFLFELIEHGLDSDIDDEMKSDLKTYTKILEEIDEFLIEYPDIEISEDVVEKLTGKIQ